VGPGGLILPKLTRKRLYAGKVTQFVWPAEAAPPQAGHTYKLETGRRDSRGRKVPAGHEFRILAVDERTDGYHVAAQLVGDPIRLLDRYGGGYTEFEGRALRDEPEAVSAEAQRKLTKMGRERDAERERRERAQQVAEQQAKQLTNKLRRLQTEAARYGVDLAPTLLAMIREAERKIAEKRT
jgi:hypothetical protein